MWQSLDLNPGSEALPCGLIGMGQQPGISNFLLLLVFQEES